MKKALPFLFLSAFLVLQACKKDKDPSEPKEDVVEIKTSFGNMYVWLYKETPKHRANFIRLADSGFFDNTTFHRLVNNFVIQGGDPLSKDSDPNNDGTGGTGYTIPPEIMPSLKHIRGSVGAARLPLSSNPDTASSGCQFYINLVNNTSLDNQYTAFGFVMKGMEVADEIVKQPKNSQGRPNTDIKMDVNILHKTKDEIKAEYGYTIN